MGYIYTIINKINGLQYVGKTHKTLRERFHGHIYESQREKGKGRPLYNAFKKYGIENFEIQLLEETDNLDEREIYWINKLDTYHNGYNATLGGEGVPRLNHDAIIKTFLKNKNARETARIHNCRYETVYDILHSYNIKLDDHVTAAKRAICVKIAQYTLNGTLVQIFDSIADAARFLSNEFDIPYYSAIYQITKHLKRKTNALEGFVWKRYNNRGDKNDNRK